MAKLLRELARALETDPAGTYAGRRQRIEATLAATHGALNDERFREFERFAVDWATKALLG